MPDFSSAMYQLTSDPIATTFRTTGEYTQPLRVAINGFGRIGRNIVTRIIRAL